MKENSVNVLIAAALCLSLQADASATETIKLTRVPIDKALYYFKPDAMTGGRGLRFETDNARTGDRAPAPTPLLDFNSLPRGITSWTVDTVENSLTVTGVPSEVMALKKTLELFDVPQRCVKISVLVFSLDPQAAATLGDPDLAGENSGQRSAAFRNRPEVIQRLTKTCKLLASPEVSTVNNESQRLFWSDTSRSSGGQFEVVPRINGDQTVSLTMSTSVATRDGSDLTQQQFTSAQRVRIGDQLVLKVGIRCAIVISVTKIVEIKQ